MRPSLAQIALALMASMATVAAAVAAAVVWRGDYDVSATSAHTRPVYMLLEFAMRRSVRARAASVDVPALNEPSQVARGAACFRDACVQCHGGPGVAPEPFAMGMQPLPGPLMDAARRWDAAELYWITRHGIKMSGMPPWAYRLSESDLWAVVAFLERLPALSTRQYAAAVAGHPEGSCQAGQTCEEGGCPPTLTGTQPPPVPGLQTPRAQAQLLLRQYACIGCHQIPGVVGSPAHVGPPLDDLSQRALIAGRLPRSEAALVRWIRFPRQVDPHTAMPDMGVSEDHARAMAAYLLAPP